MDKNIAPKIELKFKSSLILSPPFKKIFQLGRADT